MCVIKATWVIPITEVQLPYPIVFHGALSARLKHKTFQAKNTFHWQFSMLKAAIKRIFSCCVPCHPYLFTVTVGFFFFVKSRDTLTLCGLESVQKDIKTKKLEEELEKFQKGGGEFVRLMRNDASTALLHATSPERQSSVQGLPHVNRRNPQAGYSDHPWQLDNDTEQSWATWLDVIAHQQALEMTNRGAVQKHAVVGSCGWGGTLGISKHRSFGGGGWLTQELLVCNSDKCFLSIWMMCSS